MNSTLKVKDRDTVLDIFYEDMIKYHGRFFIGGVAMAFKALEMAFDTLAPGEIPEREQISFLTGLGLAGMGVIDGVEMVTRARSRDKINTDIRLVKGRPAPDAPNGGKYYFEVEYGSRAIGFAIKDGLIPEKFISLSRKAFVGPLSEDEATELQQLKEELAAILMSKETKDLFTVVFLKN